MDLTIEERVRKCVVDHLDVVLERVIPSASLRGDLGADSLDGIELTMSVEEEFETEIPDDEAERIETVDDLIKAVQTRVDAGKAR